MKQNIFDDPEFFSGYKALREQAHNYNELLEQPALRTLLPDPAGRTVLDAGCGAGDLSAFLTARGATTHGVDLSEKMLALAQKRYPELSFERLALEDIASLEQSYDLVVSSLAFHYVEDYEALIASIRERLKPGGELLFSIEHPLTVADKQRRYWVQDADGTDHYAFDDYQTEGRRESRWFIDGVVTYHRTLSSLLRPFLNAGWTLEAVEEPVPSEEAIMQMPRIARELRKPSFLIVKAKKTENPA